MCKCANKLLHLAFFIALPVLLSACGGAPAGDNSSQPSSAVANKPEVSSAASSVDASGSSITASVSSAATTSLASSQSVSSGQSYSRISRASNSASSQKAPSGFDLIAPEVTKLQLYRLSENSITLIWNEAFDNVGISHYSIERNGETIASVEAPTSILYDQNLIAHTDYSYTITAVDFAGNDSGASPAFTVRTLAAPNSSQASSALNSSRSSNNNSSLSSSRSSALSSSRSSSNSSSLSSRSSSKSASSISSNTGSQKSVKITWTHPNQRENGKFLELDEIRGYEIRYRKITDSRYTYIVINSNKVNEYTHNDALDTEFEIAVFDTNGVYSRFEKVTQ
jgi:hypothetical protein